MEETLKELRRAITQGYIAASLAQRTSTCPSCSTDYDPRRLRRVVLIVLIALTVAGGAAAAEMNSPSRIRVTLTAKNHDPHPRNDPGWQWGYCVRIRTTTGESVASTIHLQILMGTTRLAALGYVSLLKGYDHWCASIGGEDNVLLGMPLGEKLVFQAVVRADGVTVRRNWPLVVR
jgi:hypothetical protein